VNTATVYEVRRVARDNVRLLLARCDRCDKDVMHGGGSLDEPALLGGRLAHCGCTGEYELVLGLGVTAP
jgi:hypothetical protein